MAASLIKMKFQMIWNGLRRETWKMVLFIFMALYFLAIYTSLLGVIIALASSGNLTEFPEVVPTAGIYAVTLIFLAWLIGPIVGYGFDDTLDPRRFSTITYPNPRLGRALIIATMFGLGSLLTVGILVLLFIALLGIQAYLSSVLLVAVTPLAIYIFALWGRALSTTLGHALVANSKRKDQTVFTTTLVFIAVLAPLGLWLNLLAENLTYETLREFASVLLWLPVTAPFGIVFAFSEGAWGQLILQVIYTVLLVVVGRWIWNRTLAPSMVGVPTVLSAKAKQAIAAGKSVVDPNQVQTANVSDFDLAKELPSLSFFSKLGCSHPTAALAARTLQYMMKDPRISTSVLSIMIFPLIAVFTSRNVSVELNGDSASSFSFLIYLLPFVLAFMVASLPSYDSTALWGYISAGISGRTDRLGRLLGSLPAVITILAFSIIFFWAFADNVNPLSLAFSLPTVFVLSLAVLQLVFTFWLPGVQPPGSSPLSTKGAGNQMIAFLTMIISPIVVFLLYAPILLVSIFWGGAGTVGELIISISGLIWGILVLTISLIISIKLYPKQVPNWLAQIQKWANH
ncbi:hypothetical protein NXS08_00380 [Gleimia sp. 6138-11-ORH1]|uniref:hypothetical protein n=1 Tax=Gleimia sp. 6138-11-ORH1 TaxID=2973937 RepID=UPI0021695E14|nr:hypothetical protein [Gleimia sp. 6138-11-ORH1]MCS4483949.1 hypothetical protein [Gleimia sp. 6138-11-ORH1]